MEQTEDIKNFENPEKGWEYDGGFIIELTDEAETVLVPKSAEVNEQKVTVKHGRIKEVMGGIQFFSYEKPFGWHFTLIKIIRDGSGNLLWVNRNFQ